MRKSVWASMALITAPIALAACGSETAPEAEAPEGVGLEVTNARLVMPAVSGNPGALYLDITNASERNIAIGGVSIDKAASAELHGYTDYEGYEPEMITLGPVLIEQGETRTFEPGGKHIMAMDLADDVAEGGSVEVTVTIAGGDKQSFTAKVVGPGQGNTEG